jgi:hypothetical protein
MKETIEKISISLSLSELSILKAYEEKYRISRSASVRQIITQWNEDHRFSSEPHTSPQPNQTAISE